MASAVSVNFSLKSPRGSNSSSSKSRTIKLKKAFKTILSSSHPSKNVDLNSNHEIATIRYSESHKKKPSPYAVFQTAAEKPLQASEPPSSTTIPPPGNVNRTGELISESHVNKDSSSQSQRSKMERKHSRRKEGVKQNHHHNHHSDIKWVVPESDQGDDNHKDNDKAYGTNYGGGDTSLPERDFIDELTKSQLLEHHLYRKERKSSSKKRTIVSPGKHSSKYKIRSAKSRHRIRSPNTHAPDEPDSNKENETGTKEDSSTKWQRKYCMLEVEKYQLEDQLHNLKLKLQRQKSRGAANSKLRSVLKENSNLKEDMDVLKSVVRRLNKEIRSYQNKLMSLLPESKRIPVYVSSANSSNTDNDNEEGAEKGSGGLTDGKEGDEFWFQNCRTRLHPLLVAYDEIIKEKDEIIKDHELALELFKQRSQEIVRENEALHKTIVDGKHKGSISMEDWQYLSDNAALVLEENDLLHGQFEALKRKIAHVQNSHQERETQLHKKIHLLEEDRSKLVAVKNQLENHCKLLAEQLAKVTQTLQSRIPMEEHEKAVAECKRLFEHLKSNYEEDRLLLKEKVKDAENSYEQLKQELAEEINQKESLQTQVQSLEAAVQEHSTKLRSMYSKMEEASKAKDATAATVAEMMALAKGMVQDREVLEKSLNEQKTLNYQIMNLRSQESDLVKQLKDKIQTLEANHQIELQNVMQKAVEYETLISVERTKRDAESHKLQGLVQKVQRDNERLQAEKKQLEADLETVWRASTAGHNILKQSN